MSVAEAAQSTLKATAPGIIPADPLRAVFTDAVRLRWASMLAPESLRYRLDVLGACGPEPSDPFVAHRVQHLRAVKAAWETYLEVAYACRMFEGSRGDDLRARLVGVDDDNFRSAFAECLACWLFGGPLRLTVLPEGRGRGLRNLDLAVLLPGQEVGVEVKAPYKEPVPPNTVTWGDDSGKITQCLECAEEQFDKTGPNLLVVVPELRMPMHSHRRDLVKAAYGESVIAFDLDAEKGRLINQRTEFSPRGKFLNVTRPGGKLLKRDGFPAYRRVSAMVCIEPRIVEKYVNPGMIAMAMSVARHGRSDLWRTFCDTRDAYFSCRNDAWVDHKVLILHNPYSYYPIPESIFDHYPQLVPRGDTMIWTDGFAKFV